MGKSVFKDLIREIKGSLGRFISIMAITALGAAFFAGVTASSGDMKRSSDNYYDEYNMNDIRIISSIGLTDDDLQVIAKVQGVKAVYGANSKDVLINYDDKESVAHVLSIPLNADDNDDSYINRLRIKEGRLPQNDKECVVKYESTREAVKVGDVLKFKSGTTDDINDTFKDTEYTVVGVVYSPCFVSYDLGSSDIGNGNISYCVYVGDDEFKNDYYTEAYAVVDGAKELDTYSDEYDKKVENVQNRIKNIAAGQLDNRKKDIKEEFAKAKEDKKQELLDTIRQKVTESITKQYQEYYPGYDVSSMIAPYIEPAYIKAVQEFDFDAVYAKYDEQMNETLNNSDDWEWYVLTRQSQYSYRDYESSADRMKAIATVFPLFFIIVAGLVCLTTMTRMVEEERGLIGTYKALGYSKKVIAFKYIAYALIASVTGGIAGCIIGLKLFPLVIYDSWNIIYQLPPIVYDSHILLSIIAITSMILVTVIAAIFSCYSELEEVPSELMRPKAPKSGKKILLEHITFIWKHMSFTMKVTMRNLFLYKKRFLMTVVGIAGCTALMTAGFGIKNSIESLIHNQYGELIHYDSVATFTDGVTQEDMDTLEGDLSADGHIDDFLLNCGYSDDVKSSEDTETAEYVIVDDKNAFKDYVTLRTRRKHNDVVLGDSGVVITEKLSKDLGIKKGDKITVTSSTGKQTEAVVSGITEMYVNHYIYISTEYYNELFGNVPDNNRVLIKINGDVSETESYMGDEYLTRDYIKGVSFLNANVTRFENMIQSLDLVTWVLIISAGLLAFVVLYNLTNVNISERRREIATIKVLGFFDPEVGMYVYRENIFLTLIGGVFGLLLGRLLHIYIMLTVEMDAIMFGYAIKPTTYIYSYLITLIFSVVVNLAMYGKLKKLPMVESLKSVE